MQHPKALARDALDTVCTHMPADQQSARAPVEARRHLLGLTDDLSEKQQKAAYRALENLIAQRFGPQDLPARKPPARPAPETPDIPALIDAAIGGAFATTFDGSDQQAQAISNRAWSEAQRVIHTHTGWLDWIARLRLRRLARRSIAREQKQLLTD